MANVLMFQIKADSDKYILGLSWLFSTFSLSNWLTMFNNSNDEIELQWTRLAKQRSAELKKKKNKVHILKK